MFHHLFSPFHGLVLQTLQRHHRIDQPHLQCFLCRILAAEEPDFTCFLLSYNTCQVRRAESGIKTSHLRTGLPENGILRSDGQVAHHMKHMAAAYGISVHHSDDGLRQRTDLLLHIQHIQTGHTVRPNVTSMPFHVHVASATESLVTGARQHHDIDVLALAAVIQRITDFRCGGRRKGITVTRTVNRDFRNPVIKVKQYILILLEGCPFSCFHF